jgi:O-antigen ligase
MITITLYCAVALILSRYGECGRFPYWIPSAALIVLCAVAILQFFDLNPLWLYPDGLRWSGREREYNGAFLSLTGNADLTASVLSVGFAFLWPIGIRKRKWFCLLSSLLCLIVLAFSGIRAGLLGAIASVILCLPAVLPLTGKGKRRLWISIGLFCLCVLLLIYLVPLSGALRELHELLHGRAEDSFGSGRIYIWRQVWPLVKERPLLGGGPDTLGQRGLAFVKAAADGTVLRRGIDCAHCEPLHILVNQGFPALLFLTAAVILTLLRAAKCGTAAGLMLTSAMTAYIVTSFFSIGMCANASYFWLIWGSLLNETSKYNGNQRFNVI